jgi:hypothetical protein
MNACGGRFGEAARPEGERLVRAVGGPPTLQPRPATELWMNG